LDIIKWVSIKLGILGLPMATELGMFIDVFMFF